jgi:membrane protein DedA with SNARE-associated domain
VSDLFSTLGYWLMEAVYYFGYPGIAVLIALSNLPLPVPSQLILPLAGFLVGQGKFSFSLVLLASTLGALAGALVPYFAGRQLGEERLRCFLGRHGRFMFVGEKDLDKVNGWFEQHGGEAVFIARLFPGAGSLISVPAGIERMPLWRFVVYTVLGNGFYNAALVSLGWALGSQWDLVDQYVPILEYVVLAAVVGVLLWFLGRRWKAYRGSR